MVSSPPGSPRTGIVCPGSTYTLNSCIGRLLRERISLSLMSPALTSRSNEALYRKPSTAILESVRSRRLRGLSYPVYLGAKLKALLVFMVLNHRPRAMSKCSSAPLRVFGRRRAGCSSDYFCLLIDHGDPFNSRGLHIRGHIQGHVLDVLRKMPPA